MRRRQRESLTVLAGVILLFMVLVAFVKALLSPLLAAFVGGVGMGAIGVYALLRLARSDDQPAQPD